MQLWWKQLASQCRTQMLAPIYRLYEHRLLQQVRAFAVPRHVGLILDGNRRFGRKNGLRRSEDIYMAGANKLDDLLEWCFDLGVPAITLWVFSTENSKRPADEVTGILAAVEKKLKSLACDSQLHTRRIRVRAVGRLESLPPSTLAALLMSRVMLFRVCQALKSPKARRLLFSDRIWDPPQSSRTRISRWGHRWAEPPSR